MTQVGDPVADPQKALGAGREAGVEDLKQQVLTLRAELDLTKKLEAFERERLKPLESEWNRAKWVGGTAFVVLSAVAAFIGYDKWKDIDEKVEAFNKQLETRVETATVLSSDLAVGMVFASEGPTQSPKDAIGLLSGVIDNPATKKYQELILRLLLSAYDAAGRHAEGVKYYEDQRRQHAEWATFSEPTTWNNIGVVYLGAAINSPDEPNYLNVALSSLNRAKQRFPDSPVDSKFVHLNLWIAKLLTSACEHDSACQAEALGHLKDSYAQRAPTDDFCGGFWMETLRDARRDVFDRAQSQVNELTHDSCKKRAVGSVAAQKASAKIGVAAP
jgi:hypothetical protein